MALDLKLEQNTAKHPGKLLLAGWVGTLIVHWQGRHCWDSIGTMGCGCLLWWRCGSVSTGSRKETAICMPARWSKQHFHPWSFVNFMFALPSISCLSGAKLTFVFVCFAPVFVFQQLWLVQLPTPLVTSPGAWYDDGAPRWFREKRRLLRCVLLRIEPSRIKSDGSTTAFVVGGHLSILPCLWEA